MPADRGGFPFQPRHQVGDGDVKETGCGDGDDDGDPIESLVHYEVTYQAANDGGQAGDENPEQRLGMLPARGEENGEVPRFARNFVGNDGQRCAPAQNGIGQKRGEIRAGGGSEVRRELFRAIRVVVIPML